MIKINWIKSHQSVARNEMAGGEAKKAAMGKASSSTALPAILGQPLPRNATAMKQEFREQLQLRWWVRWRESPQLNKFSQIDPKFPPKAYYVARDSMSRTMPIRTGHIPLNKYLHKIGKAQSARC